MGNPLFQREADLLLMTSNIVAAQISNKNTDMAEIPCLIDTVYQKLADLATSEKMAATSQRPAIAIADSVTPDYIICLEDGKQFKMLKKHLKVHYNMTPEEYRLKWQLPLDYPMVAPNYAVRRQELAKESGLGRNRG
jgi:predicted transcriptional regulator